MQPPPKLPSDPEPDPPPDSDLEAQIKAYSLKADSLHATLPVAGFVTQLKVPIDIADIYVPLRAVVDLRGLLEERFADAAQAGKNACGNPTPRWRFRFRKHSSVV